MPPDIDCIEKRKKSNSTYPDTETSYSMFMDASAFSFLKENIMGMIPELALLIKEQQDLRLQEKDDKISLLKTQIDQMEFLLMSNDITALPGSNMIFPKDISDLRQNFPNPFEQKTTVQCFVPTSAVEASLEIVSPEGKTLITFTITERCNVNLDLDLACLADGYYIYQLKTDGQVMHCKELIVAKSKLT